MIRIVHGILAASAIAFSGGAAHAERCGPPAYYQRHAYWRELRRERALYELRRERDRFYARWDGNPYERVRFERWYHRRCAELE